jgi:PKHD-type hydroxylase
MLIEIPDVLTPDEIAAVRGILDAADWVDGNVTSGLQSALAKRNRQLPEEGVAAQTAGAQVLAALGRSALFFAAALPLKTYPPLFNRYDVGDGFDTHVDNAVRIRRGTEFRVRSDLSATLFLTEPSTYDGGELIVETAFGVQSVKLPAGHLLLYPASSLHRVAPITRGRRLASFFWVQSMVRDDAARRTLLELDSAIQVLARDHGQANPAIIQLTGIYHNLLRRWADA